MIKTNGHEGERQAEKSTPMSTQPKGKRAHVTKPSLIRQRYQHKRFRFVGYTTVAEVEARYKAAGHKRSLSQLISLGLIIIIAIALLLWIKPWTMINELIRSLGLV